MGVTALIAAESSGSMRGEAVSQAKRRILGSFLFDRSYLVLQLLAGHSSINELVITPNDVDATGPTRDIRVRPVSESEAAGEIIFGD